MKKFLVVLLAVMFLCSSAFAQEIDLDSLSNDELYSLLKTLQTKLFSEKLISGALVPLGNYAVGSEIPAGGYLVSIGPDLSFTEDSSDGRVFVAVLSPEGKEIQLQEFEFDSDNMPTEPFVYKVSLEEGMALEVGASYMSPITGYFSIQTFSSLLTE